MATKLAAQCYTIRDHMQTQQDIAASLARLAGQGWRAVQLSGQAPTDPGILRELADQNGLRVAATHNSWQDLTEKTQQILSAHHVLGCKYVGVGSMPEEYRGSAEGFETFAKKASDVAKQLSDGGCTFIYHNHDFEFTRFGGRTGMDILLEQTAPDVQFELDTFWAQAGGADVRATIKRCAGRIDVIHFKDMAYDPQQKKGVFAEIGQGNMDWPRILKACKKAGVRWYIVEQDTCPGDPFDSLKISLDYLHGLDLE
ncbi:MAG: sugar phosphate isomerase/epimerase [Eubacteriales bacterium]|nr:sugar phosphate isomerase/epimerase [Eubacteriales bacterium]